jgi:hypothetical protein
MRRFWLEVRSGAERVRFALITTGLELLAITTSKMKRLDNYREN